LEIFFQLNLYVLTHIEELLVQRYTNRWEKTTDKNSALFELRAEKRDFTETVLPTGARVAHLVTPTKNHRAKVRCLVKISSLYCSVSGRKD